ncbi:MAG: hypothetical protein JST84_05940 [Acidobacteria bacterium]|nr:hypothetical protein [Acidobacteriota bacterium]
MKRTFLWLVFVVALLGIQGCFLFSSDKTATSGVNAPSSTPNGPAPENTIKKQLEAMKTGFDKLNQLCQKNPNCDSATLAPKLLEAEETKYIKEAQDAWEKINTAINTLKDQLSGDEKNALLNAFIAELDTEFKKTKDDFTTSPMGQEKPSISKGIKTLKEIRLNNQTGSYDPWKRVTLEINSLTNPTPFPSPTDTLGKDDKTITDAPVNDLLLYVGLSLLFLTILGVAGYAKWRVDRVDQRLSTQLSQKLSEQVKELSDFREQVASAVNQHMNELESLQKKHRELNTELTVLNTELTALRTRIHTLEQTLKKNGDGSGDDDNGRPPKYRTAAEWLRQIGARGIIAKPAFMLPDALQKAADNEGIYMLGATPQPGVHVVIPYMDRFTSSQDFPHYQKFYDCEYPTSGEILILEPAQAMFDPGANQWHLSRKGRLEIG